MKEEEEHVEFWKKMLVFSQQGIIPQIFDDCEIVKSELEDIRSKVHTLMEETNQGANHDISRMFLIAYKAEYFLLHPAFEKLFAFAGFTKLVTPSPEFMYENHIKDFITGLNTFGKDSLETELLGKTLERLWLDSRYIAQQSMLDPLTGIFNRRGFFDIIKPLYYLAERNNFSVAIIMVDIDNFKILNDKHGHQAGDKAQKEIAEILSSAKRESDILGRYGGEEFILYLSSIEHDSLLEIAERIRHQIEKTTTSIPMTVSIGGASGVMTDNLESELQDLIHQADTCLYQSKENGKNRVTCKSPQ